MAFRLRSRPVRMLKASLVPAAAAAFLFTASSLQGQEVAPSQMFGFEDLSVNEYETTSIRDMLRGKTHAGFPLDMHVTELEAGEAPHPPHRHLHEEMLLIIEGQLDVTVEGHTERLSAGSAVYIASNDEHGWRNVGSSPARYFVVALGDDAPTPTPEEAP